MAYGVKANIRAPHRFLRFGSLCWLVNTNDGWGNARFQVRGLSRGGRVVKSVWVDAGDLTNYRAGWVPDGSTDRFTFASREEAQAWADTIGGAYSAGPVRAHAASFGHPELAARPTEAPAQG